MFHPLKGEPLTVLVMPNIIALERTFDVNASGDCFYVYILILKQAHLFIFLREVVHVCKAFIRRGHDAVCLAGDS